MYYTVIAVPDNPDASHEAYRQIMHNDEYPIEVATRVWAEDGWEALALAGKIGER